MNTAICIIIFLVSLVTMGYSFNAVGSEWEYVEKDAAQGECRDTYPNDRPRFHACAIGVTLYGDGPGWHELDWSRARSYSSCRTVCNGTGSYFEACRNGCKIARDLDD